MPGSRPPSYDRLDPEAVRSTVDRLQTRIAARFPQRNLVKVAGEVRSVVDEVSGSSARLRLRLRLLKYGCRVIILLVLAVTAFAMWASVRDALRVVGDFRAFEWLPFLESAINDLAYAAIAIYFLVSVPNRVHRERTLAMLHRLRSLAHIVDMHQLTKDPERLQKRFQPTSATVPLGLDAPGLGNYLDYCSELLSLVAKTAALCAEESSDAVVLDTVSEIEVLTNGMSRKIWQKIAVLHQDLA